MEIYEMNRELDEIEGDLDEIGAFLESMNI